MNIIIFQTAIATTGTAQQLPANPGLKSFTIAAKTGNTAAITIGSSSSVTSTTGFLLSPGQSVTIPGGNTGLFVVGTAGDVLSVIGA